ANMIIVEGPDGAGKTRLVLRLAQDLHLTPERRVVDKDTNALTPLKQWVNDDLASWPRKALYDRHRLISEPIYAPIVRGSMNDGFEDRLWFTLSFEQFQLMRPIIIYCLPPFEEVKHNVFKDDDNVAVRDHIEAIYWLYHCQACRDG